MIRGASPSETAVPSAAPPLKKDFGENPIATLKKEITRLHRFQGPKNSSNSSYSRPADRLRPDGEKGRRTGRTVTTNHLLLQLALGKIVAPLPFWLRNPGFPAGEIVALIPFSQHPNVLASK